MAGLLGGTTARVHAAQTSPTKTSITTNAGVLAADEILVSMTAKAKGGVTAKANAGCCEGVGDLISPAPSNG